LIDMQHGAIIERAQAIVESNNISRTLGFCTPHAQPKKDLGKVHTRCK
jgi:hypothetical protein